MTNIYDNVFWLWLQPMSWCQKRVGLWLKLQAAAWISFAFSQTLPKWPLVGHLIFLCLKEIENNTSKWNENTFLSYSDIVRIKSISLQKHSDISMRRAAEGPITSTLLLEVTVLGIAAGVGILLYLYINRKQLRPSRHCFQFTSIFCSLYAPEMPGHPAKHLKGDLRNKPSIFWLRQFL